MADDEEQVRLEQKEGSNRTIEVKLLIGAKTQPPKTLYPRKHQTNIDSCNTV